MSFGQSGAHPILASADAEPCAASMRRLRSRNVRFNFGLASRPGQHTGKVDQSGKAMESLLRLSEVLVSFSQRLGDCLEERMGLGTSSVTSEMVLCLMTGECSRFSIPLSLTTKQCRTMSKLWLRTGIWYVRTWHFLYSLQLRLGQ